MAKDEQKIIGVCAIISVGVGTANSMFKHKRLPSSRFLIGSGVAFLTLSALAEGQPELAKGLATGVMTTVVLGEGGGVLSYIDHGEMDTAKPKKDKKTDDDTDVNTGASLGQSVGGAPVLVVPRVNPRGQFRSDTVSPIPGLGRAVGHAVQVNHK